MSQASSLKGQIKKGFNGLEPSTLQPHEKSKRTVRHPVAVMSYLDEGKMLRADDFFFFPTDLRPVGAPAEYVHAE